MAGVQLYEVLGMVHDPRAVGGHVIGNEIQQQFHTAFGEFASGGSETFRAAEMLVDHITSHAVG